MQGVGYFIFHIHYGPAHGPEVSQPEFRVNGPAFTEEFPLPLNDVLYHLPSESVRRHSVLDFLERLADFSFDFIAEFHIVCKKLLHCFTALCKLGVVVAEP